ncbi:MAG: ABC-F family ATP-binding cassette domain-containing protein [Myxococcales bacterium]|nr:ABC-F family ATP-binding cassette domain-containing protein [Myxococcales bacterium]
MALVNFDNVHLSFSGETVLRDISLQIRRGERIGLTGRNGAGKTSLLKLITGEIQPDRGSIAIERGLRIGYLPQVIALQGSDTVLNTVMAARADLMELRRRIGELSEEAARGDPRLLAHLGQLQEEYQHAGGDDLERRATLALHHVGFRAGSFEQPVSVLSGGEQSRLMLARILLLEADLLLLDEPTNHLDIRSTEFLEEYLQAFPGGALVVTHDRAFLDAFATSVAAIEPDQRLFVLPGDYAHFQRVRSERRSRQEKEARQQQEQIERDQDFIRRTHANQKSRQAKSRENRLQRLERIEAPAAEPDVFRLTFPEVEPSGRMVFTARELCLRPGSQLLLDRASFTIERGERVGIIGPNGCGKTTLLEVLAQKQTPEKGEVKTGFRALIGYYDQMLSNLNLGRTVLEELAQRRPELSEQALRDLAGRFLFHGDDVFRRVETFSGGERSRLSLLLLVMERHNVLLLDEPTNHLDIPSREVLEEALLAFPGTVIVVSHDRYFLDRVARRILAIEDRALVSELGTYSELRQAGRILGAAEDEDEEDPAEERARRRRREEFEQRKRLHREREGRARRLRELEAAIHEREQKTEELVRRMSDPSMARDWAGLEKLQREKKAAEDEHETLLVEWEQLASIVKENDGSDPA